MIYLYDIIKTQWLHQNSVLHDKIKQQGSSKEREKILSEINKEFDIGPTGIRIRDKFVFKVDKDTLKN